MDISRSSALACEGNRCRKNVTKFRPLTGSGDSSDADHKVALPVSVIVHSDPTSEYKYLLKSVNDPPQIRVVVPGALNRFLSLRQSIDRSINQSINQSIKVD